MKMEIKRLVAVCLLAASCFWFFVVDKEKGTPSAAAGGSSSRGSPELAEDGGTKSSSEVILSPLPVLSPSVSVIDETAGYAMNSGKISENMRVALHADAPPGCEVLGPLDLEILAFGRDESIEWRGIGSLESKPGSVQGLRLFFGGDPSSILADLNGDETIRWSPSKSKAIMDGNYGSVSLFSFENGLLDPTTIQAVPSVNYDDERRWFIRWEAFLSDTLLVGTMEDDHELEESELRSMVLYLYDTDRRSLRRVHLPREVVSNETLSYSIAGYSDRAILFRDGDGEGFVTVYMP
jgi:hypothetical protein